MDEIPVCSICLSDIWEGWRTLCGHYFHGPCLQTWLTQRARHPTCPNCNGLCFPNSVDRTFQLVLFVGDFPAQDEGNDNLLANVDVDGGVDGGVDANAGVDADVDANIDPQAEPGAAEDDVMEVAWVANIPNAGRNEVQWVADFPAAGAVDAAHDGNIGGQLDGDVVWVLDNHNANEQEDDDVIWVADLPAPHAQGQ